MPTDQPSTIRIVRRKARSLARRIIHRLDAWVGPSPHQPAEAPATGRPVPLPDEWSRDEVYALLRSVAIDNAPSEELEGYLTADFERFLRTLDLVGTGAGRALEIGANPYFNTVLLTTFTDFDVATTNCFDPTASGQHQQTISYRNPQSGETFEEVISYESLNVEAQPFPWPDGHFDVVVFCEVIEHLTVDPMAALLEIHRVLKDDGRLVLSTPNAARLENVARLLWGANIYDPYSGHGPLGRHNREFTRHELINLVQFCGFDVDDEFTADVHINHTSVFADPAVVAPLVDHRRDDLGQYLFVRATKSGAPRAGRPEELYRSMGVVELTSWDSPAGSS